MGKHVLFARQLSRRGGEIFCRHLGERVGIAGRAVVYGRAEIEIPERPQDTRRSCVFLEGIQDAGNVGAIIRSAAAFGIGSVVLDRACADPWSPKVLRAGMGGSVYMYAAPEDWLMIRPAPLATMTGAAALLISQAPCRLTPKTFCRYS